MPTSKPSRLVQARVTSPSVATPLSADTLPRAWTFNRMHRQSSGGGVIRLSAQASNTPNERVIMGASSPGSSETGIAVCVSVTFMADWIASIISVVRTADTNSPFSQPIRCFREIEQSRFVYCTGSRKMFHQETTHPAGLLNTSRLPEIYRTGDASS